MRPGTDVDLWYDDGGIVIGGLDGLEWVTFPVNVPQSGQYTVTFRTASPVDRPDGSGVINVGIHGVDGSWVGNQHVPVTGGPGEWHTYVSWNAPSTIYLPAGPQTLTMWAAGGWYNVRNMTFTPAGEPVVPPGDPIIPNEINHMVAQTDANGRYEVAFDAIPNGYDAAGGVRSLQVSAGDLVVLNPQVSLGGSQSFRIFLTMR